LRALIERGLHRVVEEATHKAPFKLRRASFAGNGRQTEFKDASWGEMRDEIYRDRGA